MFEQLVYTSRAVLPVVSPLDVVDILDKAVEHNPRRQITGALTYTGDRYVQLIEGPVDSVADLMTLLRRDPRHTHIDIVDRISIRRRAFPDWAMLFPLFTPDTAIQLIDLVAEGRRAGPGYRELLIRMGREQTHRLAA